MTMFRRRILLLTLPVLFFAAGALTSRVAPDLTKRSVPEPATLLEAVEMGDGDTIVRFVLQGADPGRPVPPGSDQSSRVATSPLLASIVQGGSTQLAFLLKNTKLLTSPPNDQALCVAARYGRTDLLDQLFASGVIRAPKNGCDGHGKPPEEVASDFNNSSTATLLRGYRAKVATPGDGNADTRNDESLPD